MQQPNFYENFPRITLGSILDASNINSTISLSRINPLSTSSHYVAPKEFLRFQLVSFNARRINYLALSNQRVNTLQSFPASIIVLSLSYFSFVLFHGVVGTRELGRKR